MHLSDRGHQASTAALRQKDAAARRSSSVLLITNDFPPRPGGIQSYLETFLGQLDSNAVTVFTSMWKPDETERYDRESPYRIIRAPTAVLLPTPRLVRQLQELIEELEPDTIWFGAAAPLAIMARHLRVGSVRKIVASTHGHEVGWSMLPGSREILRRIGDDVDIITYVSQYTRRRFSSAFGPNARLVALPGGVDTKLFAPASCPGLNLRERYNLVGKSVVLCLSRLVPRKGQDTLVAAMPELLRAVPKAHLLIVGGGPYRRTLEKMVHAAGIGHQVSFTGRIPASEIPDHYRLADVYAMPCRTRGGGLDVEGLGIVFLEAASCGVPVIAGNSGGAPETVIDGKTGLIVPGNDPAAVAGALSSVLGDPTLAKVMGEQGRRWVESTWSWDVLGIVLRRVLHAPGDTY